MSEQKECRHDEVYWELDAAQEKGWRCLACRANLGFRPDLDRTHTSQKVESILHSLHDSGITYVSNSTEGYQVIKQVVKYCQAADIYDQQRIAFHLLDEQEHTRFWQKEAQCWLEERKEHA